jgi:hypothetical protein
MMDMKLEAGYLLDAGYWILDTGCWILDDWMGGHPESRHLVNLKPVIFNPQLVTLQPPFHSVNGYA